MITTIFRGCLLAIIAIHAAAGLQAAAATRVEVIPWSDSIAPPPFAGTNDERALVPFPPDTLRADQRTRLQLAFVDDVPSLDGDLSDWPVVRWREARGSATHIRGSWSGPGDASMRFAILWCADGLVLGAEVRDDSLVVQPHGHNPERVESVLLYVGSSADVITRYWRGAERAFRVWADGRLEGWTRLHNRRPVLFDPATLGARGAAQVHVQEGTMGRIVAELFIPWDALFPALPHAGAGLLGNVLFEDLDGTAPKLFAWSTRVQGQARAHAWASLAFVGGPPDGTCLRSVSSSHFEPGQPLEWSFLRWGGHARTATWLDVRRNGERVERIDFTLDQQANIVRVFDLPDSGVAWPQARRLELELGSDEHTWRRHVVRAVPTRAGIDQALAELEALPDDSHTFPSRDDVAVRLLEIAKSVGELRDWYTMRHQPTGILATRSVVWSQLEPRLAEVELLRDLLAGVERTDDMRAMLAARWPRRDGSGHPIGQPVLRGQRSALDQSIQPYVVYVPTNLGDATSPLLVVLHGFGEDERQPFEGTPLAQEAETRGWIVASPYGRGNTGFMWAGEPSVLDVIEAVRAQLPVDGRRIYLAGYQMGGTGAWLLSLRHSELFAATTVVSAYGDMDQPGLFETLGFNPEELFLYETQNPVRLVRPGISTAFRIVHGETDASVSVVHARIMEDRLREFGVPNELVIERSDRHGRELFLHTLAANLDSMAQHRRAEPGRSNPDWFGGVGGPIATVFPRGPFAVVYGSEPLPPDVAPIVTESREGLALTGREADERTSGQFAQEWRAHFAATLHPIVDSKVDAELLATHNLVVVGDPRTNRLLRDARESLPVSYEGDRFEIGGQSFDYVDAGIMYAMASPTTPGKTWVVLSGMAERLGGFDKSLLKLGADFVVTNDRHEAMLVGHFRGWGSVDPQLRRDIGPRNKR